jgi:hypothetical protein
MLSVDMPTNNLYHISWMWAPCGVWVIAEATCVALQPADPANDFHVQMAKLAHGLLSGEYSRPLTNPDGSEDTTSMLPCYCYCHAAFS